MASAIWLRAELATQRNSRCFMACGAARLREVRRPAAREVGFGAGEVLRESLLQDAESLCGIVGELEQTEILARDGPPLYESVEVDDVVPILASIQQDGDAPAYLARLHEREQLEQLVERAEPAGEDHQRQGGRHEPPLAHEEVVELEIQLACDVGVFVLLMRQRNIETDIDAENKRTV